MNSAQIQLLRRKRRHRLSVDLFPFLGIIVCVIGVIVLMISSLVAAGGLQEEEIAKKLALDSSISIANRLLSANDQITELTKQKHAIDAQLERARQLQEAQDQLASLQRALDDAGLKIAVELTDNLPDSTNLESQWTRLLQSAKTAMAALQSKLVAPSFKDAVAKAATLRELLAIETELQTARNNAVDLNQKLNLPDFLAAVKLQQQIDQIWTQIASIQEDLTKLPKQVEAARTAASEAKGSIDVSSLPPSGSSGNPVFIECHSAGITVFRIVNGQMAETHIDLDKIQVSRDLRDIVQHVVDGAKNKQSDVINLLVRPDGVPAFDRTMSATRTLDPPFSSLPIAGRGKLRFKAPAAIPAGQN